MLIEISSEGVHQLRAIIAVHMNTLHEDLDRLRQATQVMEATLACWCTYLVSKVATVAQYSHPQLWLHYLTTTWDTKL